MCVWLGIYYMGRSDWNNMALYPCWSVDTDIISVLLDKHRCGSLTELTRSYFVWEVKWYIVLVFLFRFAKWWGECRCLCHCILRREKKWYVTDGHLFVQWNPSVSLRNSWTENEVSNAHTYTERYQNSQPCIEHTSLICHTTQITWVRKEFPILTFANTSLKRIKFSRTHTHWERNEKASRRGAIFRWNIQHHYYCFTHFREHVSDSANDLVKCVWCCKSTPLKTFGLRMRVDVHFHRVSSTLPLCHRSAYTQFLFLRACCHAISVKMMKVYPQPQVKFRQRQQSRVYVCHV